ncbi:MAG: F0F1 ATP synthase subunit alpha [Acidobacteriota bacterium]|nr:F0F1 ATP synthase subunit alpha [Acidobacteriota bacterium]
MTDLPDRLAQSLRALTPGLDLGAGIGRRGVVTRVADDVAWVAGLDEVGSEELVVFDAGTLGMALDLGSDLTGVVLLSDTGRVVIGQGASGLGRLPSLPVGPDALGRVLDPLGDPLDGSPPLPGPSRAVFQPALEFIERKDVDEPLATGVMVLDGAIPIGRGQRELIIGDRNTGKTALALDIVAAQRAGDVACVYVLIGQPMSRVEALRATLEQAGATGNTAIIAADASRTPGLQYLAPYAGAALAEALRDLGQDVLVVYDDLTKHADVYRELSLLLDRPPGREAFPGDIFYIHAELLERASARRADLGGGSITALPIVETTDSDLSAYIPTNLISITDGQVYLDPARHERNERPAVDVGRSVSRIGAKAQPDVMRQVAKNLRILISRFEALESLTRVGLEVDASTARTIRRGRVLRDLLRQPRLAVRRLADQIVTLTAVTNGWLDEARPAEARAAIARAVASVRSEGSTLAQTLDEGRMPDGEWVATIQSFVNRALAETSRRPTPAEGSRP